MDGGLASRALGAVVGFNNGAVRSSLGDVSNPRHLSGQPWNTDLENHWPEIRAEWDAFVDAGGRLPRIEDVLDESQGNEGLWRAGLLIANGGALAPLADRFPVTTGALLAVPGMRSALWSELEAGAEIPEHRGPDAGVLRYHLGVRCGSDAGLEVGGVIVPYEDGRGILFDDTAPHAAWNRGPSPRVTIFCELYTPLPPVQRALNRAVHGVLSLDPRYRLAPRRAAEWDRALNHQDR